MAYYNIEKRLKSDGTPRYRCNVIIKEKVLSLTGKAKHSLNMLMPKHGHTESDGIRSIWHSIIKCS